MKEKHFGWCLVVLKAGLPDEASQTCMSGNCASLNSSLPPVTDLNTGIVYFNEYYAICNEAQRLRVWQPNLACTSYVYDQIVEIGAQALLEMDPTIFKSVSNLLVSNAHFPSYTDCSQP